MSQQGLPDGTKTGRGSLATEATKQLWREAYEVFQNTPVPFSWTGKMKRTARMNAVMETLSLTRKQAKRRVRNYEQARRAGRI